MLGLYISIPFCRSKCTYCNFASGVYPAGEHARYVERLIEDLRGAGAWAHSLGAELPRRVDTVYLGGGTPSLLEPELLHRLFSAIRSEFDLEPDAEITMECAPGQLPGPTLEAIAACGVNRVSLGVQSFVDREARESGRLHTRAVVEEDVRRLRAAGIANLNLDLIAGLAGQTFLSWEESLAALTEAGPPHASMYMLEVDEDSRLGRELLAGGARYRAGLVPSNDAIARMYERGIERLAQAGLAQYEISNFSRPGSESRHNLRYWQRRPYLGLGLDASSMLRQAEPCAGRVPRVLRASTGDDLKGYLAGNVVPEIEWLPAERQLEEAWFLGLRLNTGIDMAAMVREFGEALVLPARETAAQLAEDGMLAIEGNSIRLTERGRLLANSVFQEFLADPVL
jgi:oxygen-independent coproporphyrinogen-3 oxidase